MKEEAGRSEKERSDPHVASGRDEDYKHSGKKAFSIRLFAQISGA
jgi:hypothetical protein